MLEAKQYQIGEQPQNLVIFLHGYNGTLDDHKYAIDWLRQYLQQAILITPQAPQICDKNPQKRQWFGMLKYDSENKRSNPQTPVEDIFAIYNDAALEIDFCAETINTFIDTQQRLFNIDDAHTFLIGFSQGAMLALYTALTRPEPLGGAFVLSGLVAGEFLLEQKISAEPQVYMFHGTADLKVQSKTFPHSVEWLENHQIPVKQHIYSGLAHRINEDEIMTIATIINPKP